MMPSIFLSSLTKAINAYLQLDPESNKRIRKLQGKIINIELLPLNLNFQFRFNDHSVVIVTKDLLEPETIIRGTPLQMLGVMLNKDNRQGFFSEDLHIAGNAELGQEVIGLFDELHIDWEEALSHVIGDVPSYHVGRFFSGIKKWLQQSNERFASNVDEYLHEEIKCLPSQEELNEFFSDIDNLRMDADRLALKIALLHEKITEGKQKV